MAVVVSINYVAVLLAAVASFVLGALWYSALFGKSWMKLMGFDQRKLQGMKKGVWKSYAAGFVAALVMSYVLAHFVKYAQAATALEGIAAGFWVWLGFVATIMLGAVIWEGKPPKLYAINAGYYLVSLALMGAILAVF